MQLISGQSIRVLNFDSSVTAQKSLLAKYSRPPYSARVIDMLDYGPLVRMWARKSDLPGLRERLEPADRNKITFYGSGDFHHLSYLLIDQFKESISVIIFDHHPDWDMLPPKLGCGSWVTQILKKENIEKVIMMGVSSGDISTLSIQTGNIDLLRNDRLEIYPYSHKPTCAVFKNVPDNISINVKRKSLYSEIQWQELKNKNLEKFFMQLMPRIKSKDVYVSIDKDCLKNGYALTNWEEGSFSLDELLSLLKMIKENLNIVGLDITGEYSAPNIKSGFKAICSRLDHPKDFSAKSREEAVINSVNEETNLRILSRLTD